MTPSTSKPAKLLTSLWMRLSCEAESKGGSRHAKEEVDKKEEVRKQSH